MTLQVFVHEFSMPANNIVSLRTLVGECMVEANLLSLSSGRWYGWILATRHVWKEDFGMKYLVKKPLKRWEPLGGFGIASLNFLNKNVKYLEWLGNEKDKEGKTPWRWRNETHCILAFFFSFIFSFGLCFMVVLFYLF